MNLPGHRYSIHTVKRFSRNRRIRRWRYNLTPAKSKFKTPMLDHQDKHMMKAQVHVSKSFAISNVQDLPRRKHCCQMINLSSDFLIEMPGDVSQAVPMAETQEEPWMLFIDGSSCVDGSGARLILTSPEGVEFTYALRFQFTASNNEAKYEALTVVPYAMFKMRQTAPGGWIKAKAVATITGGQVKKFVWDNIVCRFGIPSEIVSYNGKQFSDNPFKDWCDKLNITQRFTSVKHPQSNGLVERANRSLGEGIKSRLGEGNKNWVEELSHVFWAHRTMIKSSHGDMPFSLTYRTEAVIPTEIRMPTYRTAAVDVVRNDKELLLNLDLLEERREHAAICEAKAKSKMAKYYNARVHGITFKLDDFVYRSNDTSYAVAGGKLGPKWEVPYEVTEALGNGAYKLWSRDGTILPRT
uniref:Reverse transcriptase domain-containing protein n=1 Tax=Tanacetum cinerariifolium TaxID=118510 RepID=A0A699HKB9_TANCI|nr:reverse transcriptase domain-containing protein [Tanacetum cinerariifolium]